MEVEAMARYHMDIIVIVVNNGGVYRGIDCSPSFSSSNSDKTTARKPIWDEDPRRGALSLPTTALSYHTQYSTLGTVLGAKGFEVWGVGDGTDAEGGVVGENEGRLNVELSTINPNYTINNHGRMSSEGSLSRLALIMRGSA